MVTHPWTNYEIARLRDEERLVRARAAMRALEVREERGNESTAHNPGQTASWVDRVRRRLTATEPAQVDGAGHARRRVAYR